MKKAARYVLTVSCNWNFWEKLCACCCWACALKYGGPRTVVLQDRPHNSHI